MSERPSTSLRNQRKHFVKCVDCSSQMLPRNAPKEASWTAAATLYLSGRINDGALCFRCANRRRELLGLPVEKEPAATLKIDRGYADFATASEATLKKIRINEREYIWEVSNLDSVVAKWSEQQFYEKYKNPDPGWSLIIVNNRSIPATQLGSVPVSDGDEISIVLGRGRYR